MVIDIIYLFICLFICNQPTASFILNVSVFQTGSDGDQQGQQVKLKKLKCFNVLATCL